MASWSDTLSGSGTAGARSISSSLSITIGWLLLSELLAIVSTVHVVDVVSGNGFHYFPVDVSFNLRQADNARHRVRPEHSEGLRSHVDSMISIIYILYM